MRLKNRSFGQFRVLPGAAEERPLCKAQMSNRKRRHAGSIYHGWLASPDSPDP